MGQETQGTSDWNATDDAFPGAAPVCEVEVTVRGAELTGAELQDLRQTVADLLGNARIARRRVGIAAHWRPGQAEPVAWTVRVSLTLPNAVAVAQPPAQPTLRPALRNAVVAAHRRANEIDAYLGMRPA